MSKILVIDDERAIRNTLKDILEYEGHTVELAEDGNAGLILLANPNCEVEIVLCDIKMPGMDGIEVLEKILQEGYNVQVIMISGHGTVDTAVEAIKKGAYDFIEKPLDLNRLLVTMKNTTDKTKMISQTKVLKKKISKKYAMIGKSDGIIAIKGREIGEQDAFTCHPVKIRSSNFTVAIASRVPKAHIIYKNKNNVGRGAFPGGS